MIAEPPRLRHNRELASAYIKASGVVNRYPPVSEQVECLPLDASRLPLFSYNPSIAKVNGKVAMTYRYHHSGTRQTRLGIAAIANGAATNPKDLQCDSPAFGNSFEDARLFRFHGETSMSWCESIIVPGKRPRCVVRYGHMDEVGKLARAYQVKYNGNDGTMMEKNWCFFESDENLFAVYLGEPDHLVAQIQGETVINEYKTPMLRWPYGLIRGGSVVVYDEKLLRFFHSRTDFGPVGYEPRYYVGACLMEYRPPFKVLAVSKKPIIYGSESPRYDVFHFKPNVVFPGGVMADGDSFLLALGINDAACAIVRIKPEQLNL